jgi:hypothetical protein
MNALRASADPLENDLALIYDHWQEVKRSQGLRAGLGYEPRDINASGAISVISSRVLNASAGFEEIDPNQSYEALVLNYPERFTPEVIAAAQERLRLGTSKADQFRQQDIQFFVKSSAIELFGEPGVRPATKSWVGRDARLPELNKDSGYAEEALTNGFRALVWLHEQEKDGERGRGLTAVVAFGPMRSDRSAPVVDAVFFPHTVGKELLEAHKNDSTFVSKIDASRHSRIWPISDSDVDTFLSAAGEKTRKIAELGSIKPDPHDPLNLEKIEETTALRQVIQRRNQSAFRKALLSKRAKQCAFTGTSELSVLEAAHVIPYAERIADRDRPENGLLLRSDIHKLFDAHLISINPETKAIEVSDLIRSPDYLNLRGKIVCDEIAFTSLQFHFENFSKNHR